MTLHIRLLSVRLTMMQYALMHLATHRNNGDDIILIGESHSQKDLVHIIKMREVELPTVHVVDLDRDQPKCWQQDNRAIPRHQDRMRRKARRTR